jgi:flagellin-like hook-associated protein FlgL
MANVIGIPSTRVSDVFARERLLTQVAKDQLALFKVQTQMSTGRRINRPSEDPVTSMRALSLQRLLERKQQVKNNLATNQSFMSATDTAISSISSMMAEVRANALGVVGTTASDEQRQAAAMLVRQALQQLVDAGNQNFRGRYLFAGSLTGTRPFELRADNIVRYRGNEGLLQSYGDVDLLFTANLTGHEVFGALSEAVRGTADLTPVLTFDTRLADLNGGQGVKPGSIEVSNGSDSRIVDITGCETIGDVALRLLENQPSGTQMFIEITPTGLEISLSGGTLTIRDVGSGTTASELGILAKNGVGTGPLLGRDLNPILRTTTPLDNILGARARAVVRSNGRDNDVIVTAQYRGEQYNGITVRYYDDGTVLDPGSEYAWYEEATRTLWVNIKTGYTTAQHVVRAINAAYDPVRCPFRAELDPLDEQNDGKAAVTGGASAQMRFGSGTELDQDSGIQIRNGNRTFTLTFSKRDGVETIEDLLNVLNSSDADVVATINATGTGIDIRSRLSGCDFAIGENGGMTAQQLGIRTFSQDTLLEELNFGRGVSDYTGVGEKAWCVWDSSTANSDLVIRARRTGAEWNDFTVEFVEKVPPGKDSVSFDLARKTIRFEITPGQTTANDILRLVRETPGIRDYFEAELDKRNEPYNSGTGAVDCSTSATLKLQWGGPDNDLILKARNPGTQWNDVLVQVVEGAPGFSYDRDTKRMIFSIQSGVTTAQDMINWLQADPEANEDFALYLDPDDNPSTGSGTVWTKPNQWTSGGKIVPSVQTAGGFVDNADFIITRTDGVRFEVNLQGALTIGDVLDRINNHPDNLASGTPLGARLARYGNGIELVDRSGGSGQLRIQRTSMSRAAIELGLIPEGQDSATVTTLGAQASVRLDFGTPNSGLSIRTRGRTDTLNGVTVRFVNGGPGANAYSYDPITRVLTFSIEPGVTTANDVINHFNAEPPDDPIAYALFDVVLDTTSGPNDGTGTVGEASGQLAGGEPDLLTGQDVNPQETDGLFTALLRLHEGLIRNDNALIERAIAMLDDRVVDLNFSRASLGARQQGLDILQQRLEEENLHLQTSLSADIDADMVEVISEFVARRATYEAALRATAQIFQLSLLNFL